MKFFDWLKSIFKKKQQPTNEPIKDKVVKAGEPSAPTPAKAPTAQTIEAAMRADAIGFAFNTKHWRETEGKNHSADIDKANKYVGVPLGTPWCKAWICYVVIRQVCEKWGMTIVVPKDASSQSLINKGFGVKTAPKEFVHGKDYEPKPGDVGIQTLKSDRARGHIYLVVKALSKKTHATIEGNTNKLGSRDGDGVHEQERSTDGNLSKDFSGFVDWIGWTLQANGVDPKSPAVKKGVASETVKETQAPTLAPLVKLAWEDGGEDRKLWSAFLYRMVIANLDKLSKASDLKTWAPNYQKWTRAQQATFWCIVICTMTKYESGYKTNCRYIETSFKELDAVTGMQVVSEGLLQLSYQDAKFYPTLAADLDWSKDKMLVSTDPRKTIFDAFINLRVGVLILVHWVDKHALLTGRNPVTRNWKGGAAYWSVLRETNPSFKYIKQAALAVEF